MLIQIVTAEGAPAADAVLMVANAPVAMPDIGRVASHLGTVEFDVPMSGTYEFSIFYEGSQWKESLQIGEESKQHTIVLS